MKTINTEVLVIGGGATGTGIVRDLAMRGFRTALVERRDLAHGTTGRYHGLLHSGGRYVVKDPQAAKECIEENRILRRIMPHCIEDTDGFFVTTPWDDPSYGDRFMAGCRQAGIPVEEITVADMLRREPRLNPAIIRCFRVPDASADSFLAADCNAESARQHGAQILTYYEVLRLTNSGKRVTGALCQDMVADEEVQIDADLVVNAAGAWAGKIAGTIGLVVHIKPGKGVMIAVNHRIVNTVINRCKMPADGDILVPAHTVAVIGTTDETIADPDRIAIEPWEVQLMLDEGEKLIPGFRQMRMLRAWAGVRPLFEETSSPHLQPLSQGERGTESPSPLGRGAGVREASRDLTRAFVLLDHAKRDGIEGLVSITSGKWTTYRMMAEATVNKVCEKLGTPRSCRTHLETLPGPEAHHHHLGARLAQVEAEHSYGDLICECELAHKDEILRAIQAGAHTIDDIRRDTRLGMGPCQGGFCTLRVAGMLQHIRQTPAAEINAALRDFLQERWKGLLPILWGQQLRQERLDELIYLNVLGVDWLPGPQASRLASENYALAERVTVSPGRQASPGETGPEVMARPGGRVEGMEVERMAERVQSAPTGLDVLVIGAGLAGLTAAWRAAALGRRTRLISKGWGALYWGSGCIDVLGNLVGERVEALLPALEKIIQKNPAHPYALVGLDGLAESLSAFEELCSGAGYPLHGSLEHNWLLPTAVGALRPTCLAPETMLAGQIQPEQADLQPMLIVGFEQFPDFYPGLAAANLRALGIPAESVRLDLPALKNKKFVTGRVLATQFEQESFRQQVAHVLLPHIRNNQRVGFPAVLGLEQAWQTWQDLQNKLGCPVFEMPGLPPSYPGMRLHSLLVKAIEKAGGSVFEGHQVVQCDTDGDHITAVSSEAAARLKTHRAERFILATGGILGGGFKAIPESDEQPDAHLQEMALGLPIAATADRLDWLDRDFVPAAGKPHPIYIAGLPVNADLQPVSVDGSLHYRNLYAIGTALAGADLLRERALEGAALCTGWLAAKRVAQPVQTTLPGEGG